MNELKAAQDRIDRLNKHMNAKLQKMLKDAAEDWASRQFGTGVAAYVKRQSLLVALDTIIDHAKLDFSVFIDEQGRVRDSAAKELGDVIKEYGLSYIQQVMRQIEVFSRPEGQEERMAIFLGAIANYQGGATLEGIGALATGELLDDVQRAGLSGQPGVLGGGEKGQRQIGGESVDIPERPQ